ncbi:UNKNOWN [Stylonychia lemnae]|uniref:Uncharacterized protein n=1 Tax=Stylonychia lemnae TaxID=5949 RepID=A0A078B1J2_STYLE|nr:UNKNOWN [Stylonychia lemnae]|eukprot:CDW87123.1 UNKNOWN [Stylonychia lemnae]
MNYLLQQDTSNALEQTVCPSQKNDYQKVKQTDQIIIECVHFLASVRSLSDLRFIIQVIANDTKVRKASGVAYQLSQCIYSKTKNTSNIVNPSPTIIINRTIYYQ